MTLHYSKEMAALARGGIAAPEHRPLGLAKPIRPLLRIDEHGRYLSPNLADAMFNSTEMAIIAGNFGGGVQGLLQPGQAMGRERIARGSLTYAAQASGSKLWMTRVQIPCWITGVTLLTDTSTGSATLAIGDINTAALIAAAAAYTTTDVPQRVGKTSSHLSQIVNGYDAVAGTQVSYTNNAGFGALYDDIVITTAAAALPGSGNLVLIVEYVID